MRMRSFVMLSLSAAGAVLLQGTVARAGPCGNGSLPSVVVTSPRFPVTFDHSKSISELTGMMGNDHLSGAGFVTLGITAVDYETSITSNVRSRRDGFGSWCAYPVNVIVRHGYARPIRVFVAREVEIGTCKYQATMDHEMRHVRIHEAGLWKARLAVDREVADATRRILPVTGNSSEEVIQAVNDVISEAVDRAIKEVTRNVKQENDAMDTMESYMTFSRQCPD